MPQPPPVDSVRAEAADWLARRLGADLNAQDQRAFLVWLNAGADHAQAYAQAEALWETTRDLDRVAGDELRQARDFVRSAGLGSSGRSRRRLAAAAAVMLAAGGLWRVDEGRMAFQATYRTVQGQRLAVDLPDGSRMELNTNSEAVVSFSGHVREIRLLRGQGVFTVANFHDRPFEVLAGSGRVRDIGTQFDVRIWDDQTRVAVLDGAVEITPGPARPAVRLDRGYSAGFGVQGRLSEPRPIDINIHAAWRQGRMHFEDQALREVLQELSRYHAGSVTVSSPGLMDKRMTGVISTDDLPLALRTVAAAMRARLSQTGPQAWRLDAR